METLFVLLLMLFFFSIVFFIIRNQLSAATVVVAIIHLITFIPFIFGLLIGAEYNVAIDPIDGTGYTPIGQKNMLTVFVFYLLYVISKILIWKKSKSLPPLTWVIANVFVIIGIVLNIFIILQTSYSYDALKFDYNPINTSTNHNTITFYLFYPLVSSITSVYVLAKSFTMVANQFNDYQYQNSILNYLHKTLFKIKSYPLLILVLIFPVFFIITIILMLFGQDADSMIKVFTDTTTWRFSQQSHPPALDHEGHYLCTVAARGNPTIVKPIRIGKRHGKPIIINRQLMIANAFEDVIQVNYPKIHHFIRTNYDTYGFNLSKVINTPFKSNATYILMKPLEWLFLIFLYLFCTKPEELIKRQYKN